MLIIEYRYASARLREHGVHLLEQFETWVHLLALGVSRVVAVLTDQQHRVNAQLVCSDDEGVRDSRAQPEPKALGESAAQVVAGDLVGVERNHLKRRLVMLALPLVSPEEASDDVIRVAVQIVGRDHGRDFLAGTSRHGRNGAPAWLV